MKLIDLDTIDFLEAENNKEFNRGVDNCINRLLKAPIVKAIPLEVIEQILSEIQSLRGCSCSCSDGIIDDVEDIIDKAIKEQSE